MPVQPTYPIGTPGQPWGAAERAQWRARQVRQRSYAQDVLGVLTALEPLRARFDVVHYGDVSYGDDAVKDVFQLMAVRSRDWNADLPSALITGGVHGYETSGVHGALRFLSSHAHAYAGRVNLLVAPCVSPWAYERVQRWNFDAVDPNRSFRANSPAQECAALMKLIASMAASMASPEHAPFAMHIDLHETTDTDESEFRPAVAARDGKPFEPGLIPDGFYLVEDSANPQTEFQRAIIQVVERVTHIAEADDQGRLIGTPIAERGVIRYAMQSMGLCASATSARYTTTTEVYPDSPRTSPEQCIEAQVAAVCAGLDFLLKGY